MFEQLIELDKTLFLTLNGFHSPFFDQVMVLSSERITWIPLYVAIAFSMFFSFRWETTDMMPKPKFIIVKKSFYIGLIALAGAIITFALTDTLSVQLKNLVERPRPAYDPVIGAFARVLEYKGGLYGFVSSHAANVTGIALFTSLTFKRKPFTFGIFFWAALVSYSRIYVGKHFPLDVVCGAILGLLVGLCVYILARMLLKKINLIPGRQDVLHN